MRICAFLILVVAVLSCADKKAFPKDVIQPDKMEGIFWDYLRADVYATGFLRTDSIKNPVVENLRLQNELFKMHHITKEQFYRSYNYYISHPDIMEVMLDSMIVKQSRVKAKSKTTLKDIYE